jgi:SAM-dependent methyltransferase
MGFVRANVIPILKEHSRRAFSGSLLTLGMPDVYFTYDHFTRMAQTVNVNLNSLADISLSHNKAFAAKGYISGQTLFKSMNFERMSVLDYSAFEGADIEYDLNRDDLPPDLQERFDVIIDHGTIEHVFHIPNVFNNLFKMLRVGGRMIHSSPSSNCLDHGFYMFSPTLFYDFYKANQWELNTILVIAMTPRQETEPAFYTDYEPGIFDSVSYGGLDSQIYATFCVVTKTPESTSRAIPQQGLYAKQERWQPVMQSPQPAEGLFQRVKRKLFAGGEDE